MFDRFSQREKILISILIFVIIISMYYYLIYKPLTNKIDNLTNKINMNKNELMETMSLIKQIPELKKKYEGLKYVEDIMINSTSYSVEKILEIIEEYATKNHIKIVSFIPSDTEEGTELDVMLKGNYYNYNHFLDELKILENRVIFKTLQIQKNNEDLMMSFKLLCNKSDN